MFAIEPKNGYAVVNARIGRKAMFMGTIGAEHRENIARNIRECRMKKFPGRGGGKKCAEAFGVSSQQWSPWECGTRTPHRINLAKLAEFFGVTVEYLCRAHHAPPGTAAVGEALSQVPPSRPVPGCPPIALNAGVALRLLHQVIALLETDGVTIRLDGKTSKTLRALLTDVHLY